MLVLLEQKLAVMKEVFEATQKELLLVDLENLTPILERKDRLLEKVRGIDRQLAALGVTEREMADAPQTVEIRQAVEAILENERALETRMEEEHSRLRKELREFDRQTRLRQYLEQQKPSEGTLNIKK